MKKATILTVMLTILGIVFITGCANNDNPVSNQEVTFEANFTPAPGYDQRFTLSSFVNPMQGQYAAKLAPVEVIVTVDEKTKTVISRYSKFRNPYIPHMLFPEQTFGRSNAKVKVITHWGYGCPFSKRHAANTFQPIRENYSDKEVQMVMVNHPFDFHEHSFEVSMISEVIYKLKRKSAWDFSMQMFADGPNWSSEVAWQNIIATGVDSSRFVKLYLSDRTREEVVSDIKFGQAGMPDGYEVRGTPWTYVIHYDRRNKVYEVMEFPGAQPLENFTQAIDLFLER